jgi:hypothetical protein
MCSYVFLGYRTSAQDKTSDSFVLSRLNHMVARCSCLAQ